ncbi:ABC transporter substrate-binding protein [Pectobacterium cacticida]|uniref:ABC transporter substrate-binding protein n=1 Tax=Pectobacterium cacticida TaxID=69221 RepID=A0ABZ2GAM9_9GAMM|nr:ABC transporter substrate-binding protein [Pectobacterium cacticida]UYX06729.1 ABC transporter substrate-binding protein [Pectobacterium cacticida]
MKPSIKAGCLTLGLLTMSYSLSTHAEELYFASWGGAYQDAIREAWLKPFSKETGISVVEDTDPQVSKLKAMLDTNTVSWDVVTENSSRLARGIKLGVFEKITPDMVNQQHVIPGARNDYGVPSEIFSTLIGFSTQAFPEGKPQPKTFADFWDVKKFPGQRTLQDEPATVIEAALMADGVKPADIYKTLSTPEGVDRAMNQIKKIKPYVAKWWKSGAEPVQALSSGEVVMALGWNGRFQSGIDAGVPIKMSWDDSVAQVGYFALVKGANNRDAALKLLNYIISPQHQAEFSKYIAYGPTTSEAMQYIDSARQQRLPSTPERLQHTLFMDAEWWEKNGPAIIERYNQVRAQ